MMVVRLSQSERTPDRANVQIDVAQHPVVALVRERNVLEAHASVSTLRRQRLVRCSDLVLGIAMRLEQDPTHQGRDI